MENQNRRRGGGGGNNEVGGGGGEGGPARAAEGQAAARGGGVGAEEGAAAERMFDVWDAEQDRFSFEDSERFEEVSSKKGFLKIEIPILFFSFYGTSSNEIFQLTVV